MDLQSLLLIKVQFEWLVVHLTIERVPVPKGSGQGISLEEMVFLHYLRGGLAVLNHQGSSDRTRMQDYLKL